MISTDRAALTATVVRIARQQPGDQGAEGDQQDRGNEDARDAVGQPLDGRLLVLGMLDQTQHLTELRIAPDLRRLHHDSAVERHRAAEYRVADTHIDGLGLAGHHAPVDRGLPDDDLAVGRDGLAWADDESVADGELRDRSSLLAAAGVEDRGVPCSDRGQRPQRIAAALPGPRLEVATREQERGHPGGHIEVDAAARPMGEPDAANGAPPVSRKNIE